MASMATPPPSNASVMPSAMAQIGSARGGDPGNPGGDQQAIPGSGQEVGQALQAAVKGLADKTMELARLAKAAHPPLLAYVSKIAEIGQAISEEVKAFAERTQAQGGSQSQQPAADQPAPTPTEGTPAGI